MRYIPIPVVGVLAVDLPVGVGWWPGDSYMPQTGVVVRVERRWFYSRDWEWSGVNTVSIELRELGVDSSE